MFKLIRPDTAIRIQKKSDEPKTDNEGFPLEDWQDIFKEDIPCEWKNKFGSEVYQAASINAKEPASLRLWYIPGINASFRIVRVEDNAIFEIVNVDDVQNRHQLLEIEIKRFVQG